MKNLVYTIVRFLKGWRRPSKATNIRLLTQRGETPAFFFIREAVPDDIPALATLHVKTWNETYGSRAKPAAYYFREQQWREIFKLTDGTWFCFLVIDRKNTLVGFAYGRIYHHSDLPGFSGELNKIYLLRNYQRIGLGQKLMGDVARRFLAMGINNMVLFGIPQNPSVGFHEKMGGERLYAKNGEFHGGYCWRDLNKLASLTRAY